MVLAIAAQADAPLAGKLLYRFLPFRRGVMLENLRRVFGPAVPESEIVRLAQAHYAHLWNLLSEFVRFRWMPAERRRASAGLENVEVLELALAQGKVVLSLPVQLRT